VNAPPELEQASVRRAPKFPAFMIVGGGIGAIVTFILTALFPADPSVGFGALFAYFALFGVTGGVVIGAVVAIILDRVSLRRAKTVTVEMRTTDPDEPLS
jgi:MFS family permease